MKLSSSRPVMAIRNTASLASEKLSETKARVKAKVKEKTPYSVRKAENRGRVIAADVKSTMARMKKRMDVRYAFLKADIASKMPEKLKVKMPASLTKLTAKVNKKAAAAVAAVATLAGAGAGVYAVQENKQ